MTRNNNSQTKNFPIAKEAIIFSDNKEEFFLSEDFVNDLLRCYNYSIITVIGQSKVGKSTRLNTLFTILQIFNSPFKVIGGISTQNAAFLYSYVTSNYLRQIHFYRVYRS
jgi:ABC-type phosphate transport system ATPase subunit